MEDMAPTAMVQKQEDHMEDMTQDMAPTAMVQNQEDHMEDMV